MNWSITWHLVMAKERGKKRDVKSLLASNAYINVTVLNEKKDEKKYFDWLDKNFIPI